MAPSTSIPGKSAFPIAAVVLTCVALALREYYILVSQVDAPVRGDIREYVAYAWNLLHHGVFSQVPPGEGVVPTADAYRSPGYPVFLAAAMAIGGTADGGWYSLALHSQAALGAATVLLTMLCAKECMPPPWAIASGALLAVWPHHIAATGVLLSEVWLGFWVMLALLLQLWALRSTHDRLLVFTAGLAFGCASLVSPVMLLFPFISAGVLLWARRPASAALLVGGLLLVTGSWALRNASIPEVARSDHRAAMNLVQGSWPSYHTAVRESIEHASHRDELARIGEETRLMIEEPIAGWGRMLQRFGAEPATYLRWYFFDKPYLLWAWDIRVGRGDVYFLHVTGSPLETNPLLRGVKTVLRAANPGVFAVSAGWALLLLVSAPLQVRRGRLAALTVAALAVYLTAVHWVFQAEPRYATAYRPLQMVLLAGALYACHGLLKRHKRQGQLAT